MAVTSVGIDISERSIEAVTLTVRKGVPTLTAYVRAEIPAGTVIRGSVEDVSRLAAVLAGVLDDLVGPKRRTVHVGLSIPEEIVYSNVFTVPSGLDLSLVKQTLTLEAPDRLPIAMDDVVEDFAVVGKKKDQSDALYCAVEREKIIPYMEALAEAGAQAKFIDTQSMALARALLPKKETEPVLIADIGQRITTLIVSELGGVRSSQDILFGGDMLNEALEHQLKVTMNEAETLKVKAGFNLEIEDGRLVLIMQKPISKLTSELQRSMKHYAAVAGRPVSRVVLAGGTSLVPEIAGYLASNMSSQVVLGDPLQGVAIGVKVDAKAFKRQSILYANAIGLALRGMGIRAAPGIDLTPKLQQQKGMFGSITAKLGSIATLFGTMAPTKKSQPKKTAKAGRKPAAHASVANDALEEKEPVAAVAAENVAPPVPAAPEPVKEAPVVDDVASVPPKAKAEASVPPEEADVVAPAKTASAKDVPKEDAVSQDIFGEGGAHAYGRGVGDLLGSVGSVGDRKDRGIDKKKESSDTALPAEGTGSISITSILNKSASTQQKAHPAQGGANHNDMTNDTAANDIVDGGDDDMIEEDGDAGSAKERRGPVPILIGVLIVLAIIAVVGVMMFLRKNGGTDNGFLSSIFGGKTAPAQEAAPAEETEEMPSSVSVGFIAATKEQTGAEKPVIVTRAVETDVTLSDSFPASGEVVKDDAVAEGTITVVNTSSKPYTFIATTRFQNPDGILFRMKKTTNIQANGSTDVEVYADKAGASGDIGPSTFIIPGLSADLHTVVYGESKVAMTGGSGTAAAVTEEDLVAAKTALTDRLNSEAGENFKVMVQGTERILSDLITATELSFDAPKAGTEGATFTASLTLRFRALMIPEGEVIPLLENQLKTVVPAGTAAGELGSVLYTVEAYDSTNETAEVRAEASIR